MHPTPPTVPRQVTADTEPLPPRGSRTSFYVTIGCLSVIAGLVLGVGGFFGVRALQGDERPPVTDEETTDDTPTTPEPTVLEETPVGEGGAVPLGSTFPIHSTTLDGEVEVTVTDVDWDATEEIQEANSFNAEPLSGNTFIMVTVEGVYLGDGFEQWDASGWIGATYVAEDGTEHERIFRVTPHYEELLPQAGVAEDGSFLAEIPFEVPADIEAGGHVVFHDQLADLEEGAWVEAA
ncbi:MAG: hypothetical protein ACTHX0_04470 [Brachybacterium sp.]